MSAPVLDLRNVAVAQGGKSIVNGVNFKVFPGELVYLVGKTGTGKTSLLRSLYGDLPVLEGEAFASGFKVSHIKKRKLPFLRRKIGIIFQDFQLLTDRNLQENLRFVMQSTGWKKKKLMQNRLEEVIELVGLKGKELAYPYQLSGGEQQRVVIARALINEPFLLLADEPTGNLDPETSQDIMELLLKIVKQGTALLMATHDYSIIKKYPSRILKVADLQVTETPAEALPS